ncbi:MAG: hypothetical protein R3Y19_05195 [Rikenellaceae bacterium]
MKRIVKPIIIIAIVALASLVVMLLWNSIIPSVVGWGALNYLEAVGLLVLCRILFSGSVPFGAIAHRRDLGDLRDHVRGMNKEQKREYIRAYMSKGVDGNK